MKTFTFNKLNLAAAAALVSMVAFTSCNQDDDMNSLVNQSSKNSELSTRCGSCNPEDFPENHHVGATITKNVDGIGDAVFTCVSDTAPYYFVHVTDKEYSAKEMDAMHYQQNSLAVTYDMLNELGTQAVNMTKGMLGEARGQLRGERLAYYVFVWENSELKQVKEKLNTAFKHFTTFTDTGCFYSDKFWVKSSDEEYPTAKMIIKHTVDNDTKVNRGTCTIDKDHYSFYFTTGDNYLMFAFKVQ